MIYQPRFWGCWIQQRPLEELIVKRCIFVILYFVALTTQNRPERAEQPKPCAGIAQQLAEAHAALDRLEITRYEPTNSNEWSLPVRIGVLGQQLKDAKAQAATK